MSDQAEITLSPVVKGATLIGRDVTFGINGAAPTITEADFNIDGVISLACVVAGGVVTIPDVDVEITALWPVGVRCWDIGIVANGRRKVYIRGTIEIKRTEKAYV